MKIKGKVYRTVVRPALCIEEDTGNESDVAEIKMLRWMCRVTKLYKIRNEK